MFFHTKCVREAQKAISANGRTGSWLDLAWIGRCSSERFMVFAVTLDLIGLIVFCILRAFCCHTGSPQPQCVFCILRVVPCIGVDISCDVGYFHWRLTCNMHVFVSLQVFGAHASFLPFSLHVHHQII